MSIHQQQHIGTTPKGRVCMKECDAVKTHDHGRDNGRRTGRAAVGLVSRPPKGLWAAPVVLLTAIIFVSPAQAQLPKEPPVCTAERDLITIPEVKRDEKGKKLRAVLILSDEYRSMGGSKRGERCLWQRLRYLKGWDAAADPPPTWPSLTSPPNPPDLKVGEPIPGPTLRARIGDLVQISFMNQVDTKNFPLSLDRGDCDESFGTAKKDPKDPQSPTIKVNVYPRNNSYPNCLHSSSTTNVHFHGGHVTPGTTGDNVLLSIRPALRVEGQIQPTDADVKKAFGEIFKSCEANGTPTGWDQLPSEWRAKQEDLLKLYDKTAPYKGVNASLPDKLKLWPRNEADIKEGKWPQYNVGAFPYCFRLSDYGAAKVKMGLEIKVDTASKPSLSDYDPAKVKMGQAPGTHWYHAHVHGSTALNVANGMAGAFIIEGPYDDKLRDFYKKTPEGLEEKVLMIQQLATSLNMLSAARHEPAPLSVNGRRQPVITMRPGQIQMWRIVNGAPRTFVQFLNVVPQAATTPCSNTDKPCVDWRQTAQDGVQFHPDNYEKVGRKNAQFNMAAGNRVDLLVKAPKTEGSYALEVVESVVTNPAPKVTLPPGLGKKTTLLTVKVTGKAIKPPMEFIGKRRFPPFPEFLRDVPKTKEKRTLVYDTKPFPRRHRPDYPPGDLPAHTVDGIRFDGEIKQKMLRDSVEEWTVVNQAVDVAHPFHIHINPFQVVEVFDPTSAKASDKNNKCYADPKDPKTWKSETRDPSCDALEPPYVWWDVRAIPAARNWEWVEPRVDCTKDGNEDKCPLEPAAADRCRFNETAGKQQCTVPSGVVIPGYFKMRSRFADFPGVFVHHCHILGHEDVGMMQFVEVIIDPKVGPTTPPPDHGL
jgi:FtsP/CotA-like multicopper oxidase with cupredoxin domain